MTDTPFRYLMRVRYYECDAQQVVFNARYGDYVDTGVTEYMRHLWGGQQALLDRGFDMMVVRQVKDWAGPARFDDVLEQRITTGRVGTSSFTVLNDFRLYPAGSPVMRAETVYVLVDKLSYEKRPIPPDLRAVLEAGAPGWTVNHAGVTD